MSLIFLILSPVPGCGSAPLVETCTGKGRDFIDKGGYVSCVNPEDKSYTKKVKDFDDFVLFELEEFDDLQEYIKTALDDQFQKGKDSCK